MSSIGGVTVDGGQLSYWDKDLAHRLYILHTSMWNALGSNLGFLS